MYMYKNIKSCVSVNNETSEFFTSNSGGRQGENLSPFLFTLFVNDVEEYLIEQDCNPIVVRSEQDIYLKLLVLLYADDAILLADSAENLQKGLTALKSYCDEWKLQLNSSKTKILIFSRRKVKKEHEERGL